ncbi:hypothetical protein Tco_0627565 [Tanacetum coccineum]|uniref:Uncharacterized protein n=1 Tax=Tanacetum coccineum TaxID=301880 RepID=A0ABQ4WN17_9ASTR
MEYSDMGQQVLDGNKSQDYIPGPEAPPIIGFRAWPEAPLHLFTYLYVYLLFVSPTADSPGYIRLIPVGVQEKEDEEDLRRTLPLLLTRTLMEDRLMFSARDDLYKFVDMVDDAPRHPGVRYLGSLDYGITDMSGMVGGSIERSTPNHLRGSHRNYYRSPEMAKSTYCISDRPIYHNLEVMVSEEAGWPRVKPGIFFMDGMAEFQRRIRGPQKVRTQARCAPEEAGSCS